MSGPQIRAMRRDEVAFAIDLAAAEGWNPGLHDAASFHAADPGGLLVAEMDGRPVGCISAVSYEGRFGFIGLYIVVPAWRGRGIGMALWRAGMARLAGQVVGLDGVVAQQDNYRRSGFGLAWRNVRHGGRAAPGGPPPPGIVPISEVGFAAIARSDSLVFPARRDAFLRAWLGQPDATGLALVEDGALAGWGLVRRCREGHKIGPLVASDAAAAGALFAALAASVPAGEALYVDVPEPHAAAMALAAGQGMQPVFETARMYAGGPPPPIALEQVYGITTFELG